MKSLSLRSLAFSLCALSVVHGCSPKTGDGTIYGDPDMDAEEPADDVDIGADGEGGSGGEDDAGNVKKDGSAGRKDSGPDGSGGGKPDARNDAKDAGLSEPDGHATIPCESPVDCENAASVGDIGGDVSSPQVEHNGATEQWLQVRVTEKETSWTGNRMHVRVTLDSPPGENFNMRAFMDVKNDVTSCDALVDSSSMGVNQQDVLDLSWGENDGAWGPNNADDSRTISLQVYLAYDHPGVCVPDGQWVLKINSI